MMGEFVLRQSTMAIASILHQLLWLYFYVVLVSALLSWVNPYTPLAPAFDTLTRPFLRPLRRLLPPVGNVDLTPLILLVLLYVLLIVVNHLRTAAATI